MRKLLAALGKKERHEFMGTVERYGYKNGYRGYTVKTILLIDVCLSSGEELTDHLWLNCGKSFEGLKEGDKITFNARVKEYNRGYNGYREDIYIPSERDFGLERPTKVQSVGTLKTV